MVVVMATREDLYRKFGPQLVEALVLIIRDEINTLRGKVGLPERTNQQIMDAIDNRLTNDVPIYNWMNNKI